MLDAVGKVCLKDGEMSARIGISVIEDSTVPLRAPELEEANRILGKSPRTVAACSLMIAIR